MYACMHYCLSCVCARFSIGKPFFFCFCFFDKVFALLYWNENCGIFLHYFDDYFVVFWFLTFFFCCFKFFFLFWILKMSLRCVSFNVKYLVYQFFLNFIVVTVASAANQSLCKWCWCCCLFKKNFFFFFILKKQYKAASVPTSAPAPAPVV